MPWVAIARHRETNQERRFEGDSQADACNKALASGYQVVEVVSAKAQADEELVSTEPDAQLNVNGADLTLSTLEKALEAAVFRAGVKLIVLWLVVSFVLGLILGAILSA